MFTGFGFWIVRLRRFGPPEVHVLCNMFCNKKLHVDTQGNLTCPKPLRPILEAGLRCC